MSMITSYAVKIGKDITKEFEKEIEDLLEQMTEDQQKSFFYTLQGQISLILFNYHIKQSFK